MAFALTHPTCFRAVAGTGGHHRHPAAAFSSPMFLPFEQIVPRFSARVFCRSLEKLIKLRGRRGEVSSGAEASWEGLLGAGNGEKEGPAVLPEFELSRLEAYTDRFRREVLCVNALLLDDEKEEDGEEEDQVIVFKGFSSSLLRPTPDDPSEPILPPNAVISSIDRLRAPYNPADPQYIDQGLSWLELHQLLKEKGL